MDRGLVTFLNCVRGVEVLNVSLSREAQRLPREAQDALAIAVTEIYQYHNEYSPYDEPKKGEFDYGGCKWTYHMQIYTENGITARFVAIMRTGEYIE